MLISEIKKEFDRRFVKEDSYQTGLKRIIYEDNQPEEIWQFIEEQIEEAKQEAVEGFLEKVRFSQDPRPLYSWTDAQHLQQDKEAYLKSLSSTQP